MLNKRLKTSESSVSYHVTPEAQSDSSAGILSMPHELLLEITQHLGTPILYAELLDSRRNFWNRRKPYRLNKERRRTLYSLSQSCRDLRLFFLPLAWEYFDFYCATYDVRGNEIPKDRQSISQDLESKSIGLARNLHLAAHVR
jgi:hypothetical protein